MSDPDIVDTITEPLPLPLGVAEIDYPAHWKISRVMLKGMRNRPLQLTRVRWEDINRYSPHMRGIPRMYALDFKDKLIRVWPEPVNEFTLLIELEDRGPSEKSKRAVA
jgi:hypothetical protein